MAKTLSETLQVGSGPVSLDDYDAGGKPGFDGDKTEGKAALKDLADPISGLQERLFAEAATGGRRSVLLVLQGMDTSGKGGVIRHCVGLLEPQGVSITSFKAPSAEELRHDFLWRIERHAPATGMISIFDRSHYEDVLIARVHELAPKAEIERRYDAINAFEQRLSDSGTRIIKCFLHISKQTQGERLLARLKDPTKFWKFNPGDVDERQLWPAYQHAYELALERCSTSAAPWFVIPSDHKWYRNWAISTLIHEHLTEMDPQWPDPDFDVAEQRLRVVRS